MKKLFSRILAGALVLTMFATAAQAKDKELVVDGEHFTARQVTDSKFNGLVAFRYQAPKTWQDTSEVTWNLRHILRPATMALKVENPANAEACFIFHPMICGYMPPGKFNKMQEGMDSGDGLWLHPMKPVDALAYFIKQMRGKYTDLKFIGSRDLPELAKTYKINIDQNQHGIGEKVTYTLDGKPVEEEFYAVHYHKMVQGEALWGLICVHSFRAPSGKLEKRRDVFAVVPRSLTMTPEFGQRVNAVHQQLSAKYKANMDATYAQIHAAGERSKANAKADDEFLAGVDRSLVAQRNAGSGAAGAPGRSANDKEDDYIRGVDTVNDPATGTSQHSLLEQYHWTDGYQSYRDSNDPNFDPNKNENGTWTLMSPAQ